MLKISRKDNQAQGNNTEDTDWIRLARPRTEMLIKKKGGVVVVRGDKGSG